MKITKHFYIKQQDCTVTIIVTDNIIKTSKSLFKKHGEIDTDEQNKKGFVISWDIDKYYILFNTDYIHIASNIAHESYHLMEWIAKDRCIIDEESKALLIGEIADELSKFLKSKNLIC